MNLRSHRAHQTDAHPHEPAPAATFPSLRAGLVALTCALALLAAACGSSASTSTVDASADTDAPASTDGDAAASDDMESMEADEHDAADEDHDGDHKDEAEDAEHQGEDAHAGHGDATHSDAGHGDGDHNHGQAIDVSDLDPVPSITVEVFEDPKSGWNIHAVPTNHRLNPQAASTDHVAGEGHMHLYVDGDKVARLYSEWYHLGGLSDGDHEIRVELSANSHSALAIGDEIIDQTVTVTETRNASGDTTAAHEGHGDEADDAEKAEDDHEDDGHAHSHEETADGSAELANVDSTITLDVAGGDITGDAGRQSVELGSMVGIVVSADVADEVHLHGYDLLRPVGPGNDAVIVFEADIPGLFEVELEGARELLFELQVS